MKAEGENHLITTLFFTFKFYVPRLQFLCISFALLLVPLLQLLSVLHSSSISFNCEVLREDTHNDNIQHVADVFENIQFLFMEIFNDIDLFYPTTTHHNIKNKKETKFRLGM